MGLENKTIDVKEAAKMFPLVAATLVPLGIGEDEVIDTAKAAWKEFTSARNAAIQRVQAVDFGLDRPATNPNSPINAVPGGEVCIPTGDIYIFRLPGDTGDKDNPNNQKLWDDNQILSDRQPHEKELVEINGREVKPGSYEAEITNADNNPWQNQELEADFTNIGGGISEKTNDLPDYNDGLDPEEYPPGKWLWRTYEAGVLKVLQATKVAKIIHAFIGKDGANSLTGIEIRLEKCGEPTPTETATATATATATSTATSTQTATSTPTENSGGGTSTVEPNPSETPTLSPTATITQTATPEGKVKIFCRKVSRPFAETKNKVANWLVTFISEPGEKNVEGDLYIGGHVEGNKFVGGKPVKEGNDIFKGRTDEAGRGEFPINEAMDYAAKHGPVYLVGKVNVGSGGYVTAPDCVQELDVKPRTPSPLMVGGDLPKYDVELNRKGTESYNDTVRNAVIGGALAGFTGGALYLENRRRTKGNKPSKPTRK